MPEKADHDRSKSTTSTPSSSHTWRLQPGVYTPQEIVRALAPLINSVITRLGPDPPDAPISARQILIDGVLSSLSIDTPQATMPISPAVTDLSRREMASQAVRIGETLIRWAYEEPVQETTITLRSRCDGHVWTPAAASLLRGSRSDNLQMQLYNEWQNQLILLRDALLPFVNFEDVQLVIRPHSDDDGSRGLRSFELLRERFMLQCLTKIIEQTTIVDVAKAFTAPDLPSGGFAIQYSEGLILPAYLSGCASLHLLQYHPARIDDGAVDLLFVYEYDDYYSAPRTEIGDSLGLIPAGVWPPALHSSRQLASQRSAIPSSLISLPAPSDPCLRYLKLELELDSFISVSIDLGQITRGRRYAYHVHNQAEEAVVSNPASSSTSTGLSKPSFLHNAADVLKQPHLVSSTKDGWHVISATDPIIRLALLGKLYPENVITLSEKQPARSAEAIGKGYGPRFIIYGGDWESVS
ncbi:hypothetical protein BGW36DRAFT_392209 [Talaromyces proteolyticus]|uniref:Uncharacterized protein n=1 Tax=Talaromyces proteolyticus TaxID=1131652 RepID=A0AAD4KGA8_9EURO|nr:uncharacterized protein BGW36DRAFT_392209 [Talaromyces proteolyticus]KAH8688811.1 hypothetical protein BGW36DRAFT_392209 [Talaromyces proteolyticus]